MNSLGTVLIAFVTSAATSVGAVYAVEKYDPFAFNAKEQVTVPELRGLTEAQARDNLKAVGLTFLSAPREVSSAVNPGLVARQSVPAGQPLPRSHPVTVALAEEHPKVPDVLGLAQAEASARLTQAGYKVQVGDGMLREGAAVGSVLEQSPKADTAYAKDQTVILRLALPAQEVEMPKVLGQSMVKAKAALEALGLKVKERWVSIPETATFVVLSQKPEAKAKLKPGDEVELSANR